MNTAITGPAKRVLAQPLALIPDMWRAAELGASASEMAQLRNASISSLAATSAVLTQKPLAMAATAHSLVPWQVWDTMEILGADSLELGNIAGKAAAGIATKDWGKTAAAVADGLITGLSAFTGIAGAVPVVGWAVDIVFGFVESITGLAAAQREADKAAEMAKRIAAPHPNPDLDDAGVSEILAYLSSDDWTDIFMPVGDPWHEHAQRGFSVDRVRIPPDGAVIGTRGDTAWAGEQAGFGAVLGTGGKIARRWYVAPNGSRVESTGDWLPQSSAAVGTVEGMIWGPGPYCYRIDGERLAAAYRRWIYRWLESGQTFVASEISSGAYNAVNMAICRAYGIENSGGDAAASEHAAATETADRLIGRQRKLLDTTVPAYVLALTVPSESLRAEIRARQEEILLSADVYGLDTSEMPDRNLAARAELIQSSAKKKKPVSLCAFV